MAPAYGLLIFFFSVAGLASAGVDPGRSGGVSEAPDTPSLQERQEPLTLLTQRRDTACGTCVGGFRERISPASFWISIIV